MSALTGVEVEKIKLYNWEHLRNDRSDAMHLYCRLQYLVEIMLVLGSFGELPMRKVIIFKIKLQGM